MKKIRMACIVQGAPRIGDRGLEGETDLDGESAEFIGTLEKRRGWAAPAVMALCDTLCSGKIKSHTLRLKFAGFLSWLVE